MLSRSFIRSNWPVKFSQLVPPVSAIPVASLTTSATTDISTTKANKAFDLAARSGYHHSMRRATPSVYCPSIHAKVSFSSKPMIAGKPTVHGFFEKKTCTWQYLVGDPTTLTAAIIDPVLDYDASTQVITTHTADSILALVKELGYKVEMVLETHIHADHLSAASYLQNRLCRSEGYEPFIGIGKRIGKVQKIFGQRYGIPEREYQRAFEKLFDDDETFSIGELSATAIHLPGHTPDHLGYQIGDNVFCGDSLFHPDIGTARCDFPGGSADQLYHSVRKLLDLPDHVKIWSGHDYPSEGRDAIAWASVKAQKQKNKHLKAGVSEEEFVKLRKERDAGLAEPRLIHPSLQINMRAGRLPKATESGHRMLHLPLRLEAEGW